MTLTFSSLRDRDDVHVLACAVGAEADAIVTGDKDLLTLKDFGGIPIIDAAEALKRLGRPSRTRLARLCETGLKCLQ